MRKIVFTIFIISIFSIASVDALPSMGSFSSSSSSEMVDVIINLDDSEDIQRDMMGVSSVGHDSQARSAMDTLTSLSRPDSIADNIEIKHSYKTIDAVSARVPRDMVDDIESMDGISSVEEDMILHAYLDDSVPLIGANETWSIKYNGSDLTGEGMTVCVIDTGIDYTHQDLGDCSIDFNVNGTDETRIIESPHPYENNTVYEWNITEPGYHDIAVHFEEMSIEYGYDKIVLYDENYSYLQEFTGNHNDTWSVSAKGDTIRIRLYADAYIQDYGFRIDKILNGTAGADWSNCSKVIGGWNMIETYNDTWDPIDDNYDDNVYHGTHVAGIVAANGSIKGVAPDAKLLALKALNATGSGSLSDIIDAIDWCTYRKERYNISVISMSLGADYFYNDYCDPEWPSMSSAIDSAVSKNISVVVATGNSYNGSEGIGMPACIENSIRVGSTTKSDSVSSFSQRSSNMSDILLAPGSLINSTNLIEDHKTLSGTSMATPHVSGAIAIMGQLYRSRAGHLPQPSYLEDILNDTGEMIYDSEIDVSFPRIDLLSGISSMDIRPGIIDLYNNITGNTSTYFYADETDVILFNVTSDQEVDYTWYLDGIEVGSDIPNWTFVTDYDSSGIWNITVKISNENGSDSFSWGLEVLDVNRAPSISITGISSQLQEQGSINISGNISDPDGDSLTIHTDDDNITVEDHSLNLGYDMTVSNKTVVVTVNDSELSSSQAIDVTIYDTISPEIAIVSPSNMTYTDNNTTISISYDENLSSCVYSLDGSANQSFNWKHENHLDVADGQHGLSIWCDDLSGNPGNGLVYFYTDTEPPTTMIYANLTDGSAYSFGDHDNTNNITVEISCNDLGVGCNNTLYCIDEEGACIPDKIYGSPFSITEEGKRYIRCRSSDKEGNEGRIVERLAVIDRSPPVISIISPSNSSHNITDVLLDISLDENASWCGYSLNGGDNQSFGCNTSVDITLDPGLNNLTVWANDTLSHMGDSLIYLTLDQDRPNMSITSVNHTINDYLFINASISETPDACMLDWNGTSYKMNSTGYLCWYNVTGLESSDYSYSIYVNDSAGNINVSMIYNVSVDYCKTGWSSWSDCISGEKTRTYTRRDCTKTTETESCSVSRTYSSGGSFYPIVGEEENESVENDNISSDNLTCPENDTLINPDVSENLSDNTTSSDTVETNISDNVSDSPPVEMPGIKDRIDGPVFDHPPASANGSAGNINVSRKVSTLSGVFSIILDSIFLGHDNILPATEEDNHHALGLSVYDRLSSSLSGISSMLSGFFSF